MPHPEHGSGSIAAQARAVANSHDRICLRNGLCASGLFHDASQFGVFGSRRETFQRALVAAAKFRTQRRFPGYQILEEVGRGGMGVIYRAREVRGRRVVALKCVLHGDATSDALLTRFRRETETAAKLNHQNIVPVYHIGETDEGLPFFAMQFAAGGNLDQARDKYRANIRGTVGLVRDVALAVQYAHDKGILHRDLKPSNILLDERGDPLVSDFGLARLLNDSSHLTRTCALFGTLPYMAPEQLTGSPATAAGDIYSLGAVLVELLSGRTPAADGDASTFRLNRTVPAVRSVAPHLDRELQTICEHCLEVSPSDRYSSCGTLASDLQSWLDDRSISARPISIWTRSGRWLRRNRILAGTVGVALVSTAATLSWQVRNWKEQSGLADNLLALRSVAVTPILNLNTATVQPVLAQTIANSLEHQLSGLDPVQVRKEMVSASTVPDCNPEQIKTLGRSSKSRTILTGTIRSTNGGKRISLRLLDAASGEPLLVRISDPKSEAGPGIVDATFSRNCYTILRSEDWSHIKHSKDDPGLLDMHAREAIVAGRDLTRRYSVADLDHAIVLFKKAIQLQPNSALAHSYLAIADTVRTHYISDWTYLKSGKEEATAALQLAPSLAEAHRALAGVYYREGRFSDALEEAMNTVELCGVEQKVARFLGMTFDTLGRLDQALSWFNVASQLRGPPGDVDAQTGDCWVKLGDDERAIEAYTRSRELQPHYSDGAVGICHLRMLEGKFEDARKFYRVVHWKTDRLGDSDAIAAQIEFFARNFQRAGELYESLIAADADGGGSFYGAVTYPSALARIRQALGDTRGGEQLLQHCMATERLAIERAPENPEAFYRLAAVESSLGILDGSVNHLEMAEQFGWTDYRSLAIDPRFDAVRTNPKFVKLLKDLCAKVAKMRSNAQNPNNGESNQWPQKIGMN